MPRPVRLKYLIYIEPRTTYSTSLVTEGCTVLFLFYCAIFVARDSSCMCTVVYRVSRANKMILLIAVPSALSLDTLMLARRKYFRGSDHGLTTGQRHRWGKPLTKKPSHIVQRLSPTRSTGPQISFSSSCGSPSIGEHERAAKS